MALTAEQLAMRLTGVGASEVSAVLGMNPYRTPMGVYLDKVKPQPWGGNERTALGNALEGWLLEMYAKHGQEAGAVDYIRPWGETLRHPEFPFALASPDGQVFHATKAMILWGIECKTCWSYDESKWWGVGGDVVPVPYYLQCQWSMAVTGLDRWDMIALVAPMRGGPGGLLERDGYHDPRAILRRYTLEADHELQQRMLQRVGEWWHSYVVPRIPPPPTGNAKDIAALKALYPVDDTPMMPANSEDDDWAEFYHEACDELKAAEAKHNKLKAEAIGRMGSGGGWDGRRFKLTNKANVKGVRSFRFTWRGKAPVPQLEGL